MGREGEKFGHGSSEHLAKPPGGSNLAPVATPRARHCWVVTTYDRQPGLLLEWRRDDEGRWQGLVVRPAPGGVFFAWVPAVMLRSTGDRPA